MNQVHHKCQKQSKTLCLLNDCFHQDCKRAITGGQRNRSWKWKREWTFLQRKTAVPLYKNWVQITRKLTRILLHSNHAALESLRIIVQSPDTDVLLLCTSHFAEIGCTELWFKTETRDRLRYIPIYTVENQLGLPMCKALQALHTLTGCDSTSSLSGFVKSKALKLIKKNPEHMQSLGNVGQLLDVDEEMVAKVESFVCFPYTQGLKSLWNQTDVDEAQYQLFCQKSQNNMLLPPTQDSLEQHIKRANYQAYIWRKALTPRQNLHSPATGHGWEIEDGMLCPILMIRPAAPESVLELTNCNCLKFFCLKNCSCSSYGLACTESCKCMEEEDCKNPNKCNVRNY